MRTARSSHERDVRSGKVKDGCTQYAIDVVDGEIDACRRVKQACRRHLHELTLADTEAFPYIFDLDAAERPVRFARRLKHWQGECAGELFDPMPWQQFILGSVFGWKKANGTRRFRYAYIEIPRKNGKSFLASVVALYMLIADGEQGAEIYAAATKRDQAKIVWNGAINVAKKSGIKQVSEHWLCLQFKEANSKFEPLASDSEKLDGLNPHCVICDELHEWQDRRLWDVLEDAFGARSQPLMFSITTAGFNKHGICYQQRSHGMSLLEAVETRAYHDDTYFFFIADVDEADLRRWDSERVWRRANPCLGQAKSLDYMRDQCHKARSMPAKENAFKNKQLDIWTEASVRWLDMECWDKCNAPVSRAELRGRKCFGSLDLSSTTDLTAFALAFPPGVYPEWSLLLQFYLPEENLDMRERRDKVPYRTWAQQGLITLTPGNSIDLDFIKRDVLRAKQEFHIVQVGFDPWKAVEISTSLNNEGVDMIQMRQGHATLGPPTAELERKVLKRQLRHGGNPVLRWMAANATVIRDSNDNIRPDKENSSQRIDGVVAAVMALGLGMASPMAKTSVYETRGAITL